MQQYVDIYSLSRHSTCFGCHAPIIRSTKNCICYLWCTSCHFSIILLSTSTSSKLSVSYTVQYYSSLNPITKDSSANSPAGILLSVRESFLLLAHLNLSNCGSYVKNGEFYGREGLLRFNCNNLITKAESYPF